jgi:hypothetical protein
MKILFWTIVICFGFIPKDKLTGRWETKPSEKGNITRVVFKPDSILEGFINKKPFVSGTYSFNAGDSTLSLVDNGCNGARGIYKVMFFSNSDSLSFKLVSDSCQERGAGMVRLVMGRVK